MANYGMTNYNWPLTLYNYGEELLPPRHADEIILDPEHKVRHLFGGLRYMAYSNLPYLGFISGSLRCTIVLPHSIGER